MVCTFCEAAESTPSPDCVGNVLRELESSSGTTVSGGSTPHQPFKIFGGYVVKPASRDFWACQDQIVQRLRQSIEAAGWTIEDSHRDPAGAIPGRLILSGLKEEERCEIVVFFFPVQDAKVGISYTQITQRR